MTYCIERQYDYKNDDSCKWEVIEHFEDHDLAAKELANLRNSFFDRIYRLIEP